MPRQDRIDLILVRRGLVPSREQAKRLIMAGEVFVAQRKITQPGWLVPMDSEILVRQPQKFVGRGGLKLEGALLHYGVDVTGFIALDVGASTGGFTDCLLQRGAVKVYAFDVGTNQLVWIQSSAIASRSCSGVVTAYSSWNTASTSTRKSPTPSSGWSSTRSTRRVR